MKRFLAIGLMALTMFSISAFANGPLLGISTVPVTGGFAALTVGYDFGGINVEAWKFDLTTPFGPWALGLLWTPPVGDFGYRAGVELVMDYVPVVAGVNGNWQYNSFNFKLGVSNTWGPFQLYGEFVLSPAGGLIVAPRVGVNILFGDLIPDAAI